MAEKRARTDKSLADLSLRCIARHRSRLLTLEGFPEVVALQVFNACFKRERSKRSQPGNLNEAQTLLRDLQPFIAENSPLTELDLSFRLPPDFIEGSSGRMLFATLSRKDNLKSITLPPSSGVETMASRLCPGKAELTSLNISGCRLTDPCVLQDIAMRWEKSLTHLRARRIMLPSEALVHAAPHLRNLRLLDLSGCTTTGLCSSDVIAVTCFCPLLEALLLEGCWRLDDPSIISISTSLVCLRVLDVGNIRNITDMSVATLGRLHDLETLSICRPAVLPGQEDGVSEASVLRILRGCGKLRELNASGVVLGTEVTALLCVKGVKLVPGPFPGIGTGAGISIPG